MFTRRTVMLLSVVLVGLSLTAQADEGRTPIPFTTPVTFPITITVPGSYVLTRNLTATPGVSAIDISTPPGLGVELDLNGMFVRADATVPVINIRGPMSDVTIRNGSIFGGDVGVLATGASRRVVLEQLQITEAATHGIRLFEVENFVIQDNIVSDIPGGLGIAADGGTRQGTITRNLVRRTADGICAFEVAGVEISNNRVKEVVAGGPFSVGILLEDVQAGLVSENTVDTTAAGTDGIRSLGCVGCKFINNLVNAAGGIGIAVLGFGPATGSLLLDNVVTGSSTDGLFVDASGNKIERNTLTANGLSGVGYGIHFGAGALDNVVGDNTASGHPGGPCAFVLSADYCDDAGPPGAVNVTQGDNFVPPAAGAF